MDLNAPCRWLHSLGTTLVAEPLSLFSPNCLRFVYSPCCHLQRRRGMNAPSPIDGSLSKQQRSERNRPLSSSAVCTSTDFSRKDFKCVYFCFKSEVLFFRCVGGRGTSAPATCVSAFKTFWRQVWATCAQMTAAKKKQEENSDRKHEVHTLKYMCPVNQLLEQRILLDFTAVAHHTDD